MRKNRATRLANRVGDIKKLEALLKPLRAAAKKAVGRDILPTRRKVETHEKAIQILRDRAANPAPKEAPEVKRAKKVIAHTKKAVIRENTTPRERKAAKKAARKVAKKAVASA